MCYAIDYKNGFNGKKIMNYSVNNASSVPAFVIKNYIPISQKVEIIHSQYGKIVCMYPRFHQAALLCAGSLIFCTVEKNQKFYKFVDLSIEFAPHGLCIEELQFIHDIMRLCQKTVPREIRVPELFDFLLYVYGNLAHLSNDGKSIALLRFFLLLDLLPEQQDVYQVAIQDPYGAKEQDSKILYEYVQRSWDNFYQYDK